MIGLLVRARRALGPRLAVCLGGAVAMAIASTASADTSLFATSSDFTGWSAFNSATAAVPSTTVDFDGVTINGAGNNPGNSGASINVGGTSPGGSLQITMPATGYGPFAASGGEGYNKAYMHAIDPGSIAAYTDESGYLPGSTVAYSGSIAITHTIPTDAGAGTYFQLGIFLKYDGHNYNPILGPTSEQDLGTVNGYHTVVDTYPYTIDPGSLTYSDFELFINSNYAPTSPIFVDSISIVPEPVSIGLLTLGGLLRLRRRR